MSVPDLILPLKTLSLFLSLQATGLTLTITDFHTIPIAYLHFELIFQPSCTVGRPIPTARQNKSCYEKDLICASAAAIYNRLRRMRPLEQKATLKKKNNKKNERRQSPFHYFAQAGAWLHWRRNAVSVQLRGYKKERDSGLCATNRQASHYKDR